MFIDEIDEELQELLADPMLRVKPADVTKSESERWLGWSQGDHRNFLPSPSQIDAAKRFIRNAAEQAERSGQIVYRGTHWSHEKVSKS